MKFVAAALAAVLSQASALSAAEKANLLSKATPVRNLEQNQNGFQISSTDSIHFNSCVSLTTTPDNNLQNFLSQDSSMMALFTSGDIVSATSVVLFSVCSAGATCTTSSPPNLYVADIATYMQLTGYRPQKTIDYCETCEQSYDYCVNGGNNAENGARKLDVQTISCDTCSSMGCWEMMNNDNGNNGNQVTLDGIVQWVDNMAQCVATGSYWNNMQLYSSFMCNDVGNGVELALFLDEDCSAYIDTVSYANTFPNDAYAYNSHSVVTYPFNNVINCSASTTWITPEQAANGEGQNNNNNNQYQANDYCTQLFQNQVADLSNCGYYAEENNGEQNNGEQNEYSDVFNGKTYDLTQQEADNIYAMCSVLKTLQTSGNGYINAKQHNVYNKQGSGKIYSYGQNGSKANGGKIFGIVFSVLVVAAVGAFLFVKYYKKKKDERSAPLVNDAALA